MKFYDAACNFGFQNDYFNIQKCAKDQISQKEIIGTQFRADF
jgi:hypothetical protein